MTSPGGGPSFSPGFFDRTDDSDDALFYRPPRLVTHIDGGAIAAVGELYAELGVGQRSRGRVLDLCSSWVSHLPTPPAALTVLGMNRAELDANPVADERVVQDLNRDPVLPFADGTYDDAVCCVSVDYLTRPVEVFREVARVLAPGGRLVCTWSNRCFPTKAIRGWLETSDEEHLEVVAGYFAAAGGWAPARRETRLPVGRGGDPLWACWSVAG